MRLNDGDKIILWILAICAMVVLFPFATAYAIAGLQILFWVALAGLTIYVIYFLVHTAISPTVRVPARVLRKRHYSKDVEVGGGGGGMIYDEMMGSDPKAAWEAYSREARKPSASEIMLFQWAECYITFSFNGREDEFGVPPELYVDTHEGDEGLLVYQGEKFKFFVPGVTRNQD